MRTGCTHPLIAPALLFSTWAVLAPAGVAGSSLPYDQQWPQWRGPRATGEAPHGKPPVTWSEQKNVQWKVEVPGRGSASPIVWGDQVFVLTAIPTGRSETPPAPPQAPAGAAPGGETSAAPAPGPSRPRGVAPDEILRFVVLAYDRETGKLRWEQTATEQQPHEGTHPDGTWASASAVTDGEVLIAHFGSRGTYGYDLSGKLLWTRDLGDMETRRGFGEGSSPALHGPHLVINWDHEGDSFVVVLDKRTGQERWRRSRDEVTSWATPLVVELDGRPQVVVSATGRIRSYDLASGEVVWEASGMTTNAIPSPVYGHGLVIAMSGFRGNATRAIRLAEAKGDVSTGPAVAWTYDQDTPYVPSPLLAGERLYFLKSNQGILSCLDAKTGKPFYGPVRLPSVQGVYASPVAAAGRVYIAGRDGTTVVLEDGPELSVLAENTLGDGFDASPAVAGDTLFLRGRKFLYALGESPGGAASGSAAEGR
jgi:outer membrane protein assembly factor BamB